MYIGYNFEEPYPTRYDHVLRAAVEILNPSSEGSKKSISSQSLHSVDDAADDEHEGDLEREEMSAKSAHAGDDQSVNQKLAMQKLEVFSSSPSLPSSPPPPSRCRPAGKTLLSELSETLICF